MSQEQQVPQSPIVGAELRITITGNDREAASTALNKAFASLATTFQEQPMGLGAGQICGATVVVTKRFGLTAD